VRRESRVLLNQRFSHDLKSRLLLIRHGESHFNRDLKLVNEMEKHHPSFHEKRFQVKFTEKYFDSELTETGLHQTKAAAEELRDVNIKYVFVSPLQRALNTCNNVLTNLDRYNKNTRGYVKPKVIVHPYIFEKIEDNCDFFLDIPKKKVKFSNYDWTLFDELRNFPLYYLQFCDNYINEEGKFCKTPSQMENFKIPPLSNYYLSKILRDNIPFEKLILHELQKLDKHDVWIESSQSTFERIKIFNKTLKEFSKKLKDDEKILAVGHSIFFKHQTLLNYDTDHFEDSNNFAYLKNCEIVSYYL